MSIVDAVRADVETAMRAGARDRVGALRLVLSELQKASKDGVDDELAVMRRERKRRLEAARAYREAGRDELVLAEEQEAELIGAYLPAELPDAELRTIVERVIRDTGAESQQDMGRVMSQVMGAVDGRADGRRVSAQVREVLGA